MSQNAQEYVARFERGEDYTPPPAGLIASGHADPGALRVLGHGLAVSDAAVREKIVTLLVDIGRRTDPLTAQGADVLQNPGIISLLAGPGLAKDDIGRNASMDALRKLVKPTDLRRFESAFVKALEEFPTNDAFLLVAKTKPVNARAGVEKLATSAPWRGVEAAKIARAALGAEDVEDEFVSQVSKADEAEDGKLLGHALGSLALIGTPRSLRVIAEHLRTPLTIVIPGSMEKSVRLNVLEALLYNFPDKPELYPNNIVNQSGYQAAEQFCTRTLGVRYTTPPPPFLKYRGFPIPLAK